MIKNIFVFTYNTETSIIVSNILKENKKKARPHVTKKVQHYKVATSPAGNC